MIFENLKEVIEIYVFIGDMLNYSRWNKINENMHQGGQLDHSGKIFPVLFLLPNMDFIQGGVISFLFVQHPQIRKRINQSSLIIYNLIS